MSQGAVTFLYTGDANSVQKHNTLWHHWQLTDVIVLKLINFDFNYK